MNPRSIDRLLTDLKRELDSLYGPRLRGMYLFGSYARNEADPESDVDVLIVLDRMNRFGEEVDRTGEAASRLSLEHGVTLSRVFVTEERWKRADSPFLHVVRTEAVPA